LVSLTSWIEDRSQSHCRLESLHYKNKSIHSLGRSTSPTGARAMPAQTERPLKRSFKSRHRRSHLFLLGPRI